MIVTVNDYLNVRVGTPSVNAPSYQYLSPGSVIETDGKLYKGDPYEGIDLWVKDLAGNYYWSGGVDSAEALLQSKIAESERNAAWFNQMRIKEVWKKTSGKGVNICVLDTGINTGNTDITSQVYRGNNGYRNFVDNNQDVNDLQGHGSHCASLISSANKSDIVGVAPDSRLFIGKISRTGEMPDYSLITEGVSWAAELDEVDIISISFGIDNKSHPTFQALADAIQLAINKGKIIIASIGNKSIISPRPVYPALFPNCISVGATDSGGSFWKGNAEWDKTTIYVPGVNIFSNVIKSRDYPNGDTTIYPMTGNSQSAAICSGVVALLISYLKSIGKAVDQHYLKHLLTTYSDPVVDRQSLALINPLKILNNI